MAKVKEDSKGRKGKAKNLILGKPHKAIRLLLCRNFACEKGMA